MTKAEIQHLRSLGDKRTRDAEGLFIAEGDKLVEEILSSHLRVRKVYTTRSDMSGAVIEQIDRRDMERISALKTATTTIAVVEQPRHKLNISNLDGRLTLALDGVQNPGNLGTIIRLADRFGIEDILCTKECADCYNPKVVQATMGSIARVKIIYTNLYDLIKTHANLIPIYGTLLDGEDIYQKKLTPNGIIIMGNEGNGLSTPIRSLLSERLLIPSYNLSDTAESLNVATATAIICSEFRRRI